MLDRRLLANELTDTPVVLCMHVLGFLTHEAEKGFVEVRQGHHFRQDRRAELGCGLAAVDGHSVPAAVEPAAAAHHVRLSAVTSEVIRAPADAASHVLTRERCPLPRLVLAGIGAPFFLAAELGVAPGQEPR